MRWITLIAATLAGLFALRANAAAQDYAEEIAQLQKSAQGHRLILLGEKHGTREIPVFVAQLMAKLAPRGALILALEIPQTEQPALDEFVASAGGPAARAKLKSSGFWVVAGDQHDGRRSEDAIDLIEQARALRGSGRDVEVLAFDVAKGSTRDHHERDRVMAQTLRAAIERSPQAQLIVLTGNVHAMLKRPDYAPPQMQQPMGSFLTDLDPYAINIDARDGEFWACTDRCKALPLRASERRSGVVDDGAYQYELVLPRFSVARLLGVAR